VAPHAELVEHRLDLAGEVEPARRAVPGRDLGSSSPGGDGLFVDRAGVLPLVAAHARDHLARHGREPASHELQGLAIGVERLHGDRRVGGHAEHGRAVGLDRHGAEDSLDVPGAFHADHALRPAHPRIQVVVADHAQLLHRAPRDPGQPLARVDVREIDNPLLALEVHLVGQHRRLRSFLERHRLQQRVSRLLAKQEHPVERVHQVDAPECPGARLAGHEEVVLAQRIGVEELGPRVVDQVVLDERLDPLAATGNPLHHAVGLAPAAGRVEDHQLAHARVVVVAADHRHHLGRMIGDRPGIEKRVRPIGVAAHVFHLARAVRVHVEQQARVRVRRVGVLPSRVKHAPVVEHRGTPIVLLVEAELADVAPVGVHEVQRGHVRAAVHAGNPHEIRRRGEDDPAVGQVAGVVAVHVGLLAGELAQARAVGADLEHLPAVVAAGHGEEHPVGVEVQLDVAHEAAALGLVERGELALAAHGREHHDLVVVARLRQAGVALPVAGQAQRRRVGPALHQQQPLEIQERIGQERFSRQSGQGLLDLLALGLGGGLPLARGLLQTLQLRGQRRQPAQVLRPLGVLRSEGRHQVADRQLERLRLDGRDVLGEEIRQRAVEPAGLGTLQLPAFREWPLRLELQAGHVGKRALPGQAERMLARREPPLERLLPFGPARVPTPRRCAAALAELGLVEAHVDRARVVGGVADRDRPHPVHRELDVVLDHDRRLAAKGDHGARVGPLVREDLDVAAVKGPGGELERVGRGRLGGRRPQGRRRVCGRAGA